MMKTLIYVAGILASAATLAAFDRSKRVGIDWEHLQFMSRENQGPIVREAPRGPRWYEAPGARRI
jgi:hypothetical protein